MKIKFEGRFSLRAISHPASKCSKLTIQILEQGEKYVQS